jgi:hypothetical protein
MQTAAQFAPLSFSEKGGLAGLILLVTAVAVGLKKSTYEPGLAGPRAEIRKLIEAWAEAIRAKDVKLEFQSEHNDRVRD